MLGRLRVDSLGQVVELGGPRQRAVLALLIIARGTVVSVDRMIDDVWRGAPPTSATGALHVYISNLRRALEPGRSPRAPARVLLSAPPGYAVEAEHLSVDAWEFEEAVAASANLTPADRRAVLRRALSRWGGPAYAEFADAHWAGVEAARLEQLRRIARERLVEATIWAGEPAEASVEAEALVRDAPLQEEGWRLLALSQYCAGRQADALATLRRARAMLAEDLGLDPGPRLSDLERDMLDSAVAVPAGATAPGTAAVLGQAHDRPAHDGSGPDARRRPPLPTPTTSLVGRDRELAQLQTYRADASSRLVTVTGPGGTGKTRMVLASAANGAADGYDTYFVALESAGTAEVMWSSIGDVVGADDARDRDAARPVLDSLAGRRVLLVLDNLEQIPEAADVVAALLGALPELRVLASSRRPLLLAGEQEFPLAPLSLPASAEVADILASGAGQMFVQHAKLVRPSFTLTPQNAGAVATLCHRLDGLPLALELAAAQTRLLAPEALLSHLGSRLGTGVTANDRPARHRTLGATIAWSYDRLGDADKQAFRRLAVFRGGADLDGVAEVALADGNQPPAGDGTSAALEPLDMVGRLSRASLIRVREGPNGQPEVMMLETIRDFALERLDASGEQDHARFAHLTWTRRVVESATAALAGPQHTAALDRLNALDNDIRAALDFALQPGDQADPQRNATGRALLTDVSARYWGRFGNVAEGRIWLERALRDAGDEVSEEMVGLLDGLAASMLRTDGKASGTAICERALAMARSLGSRDLEARQLNRLGGALHEVGRFPEAISAFRACLDVAREIGDLRTQSYALTNLVMAELGAGQHLSALASADAAMRFNAENDFQWPLAIARLEYVWALVHVDGAEAAWVHFDRWAAQALAFRDQELSVDVMDLAATIASGRRAYAVAARALSAANARRSAMARLAGSIEMARRDGWPVEARAALGEAQWAEAYAAGHGMGPEEVVRLVRALGRPPGEGSPSR